jgi:hypothetical protein
MVDLRRMLVVANEHDSVAEVQVAVGLIPHMTSSFLLDSSTVQVSWLWPLLQHTVIMS